MRARLWSKKWFRICFALVLTGVICFGSLLGVVLYGSYDHIEGQPRTMLILGCQVKPWGPSVLLRDRLDEALDYLEDHPDMVIIVSGGKGDDEHISEAACMRDYLVQAGIEPDQIIVEDQSRNTYQNMIFSAQVMRELELDLEQGVLVVSNGFHLTRSRMLWNRVTGQEDVLSTLAAPSTHIPSALWMYIREPLALVKSFLLDR